MICMIYLSGLWLFQPRQFLGVQCYFLKVCSMCHSVRWKHAEHTVVSLSLGAWHFFENMIGWHCLGYEAKGLHWRQPLADWGNLIGPVRSHRVSNCVKPFSRIRGKLPSARFSKYVRCLNIGRRSVGRMTGRYLEPPPKGVGIGTFFGRM